MHITQGLSSFAHHIKTEFIYRLDPDHAYLKQAVRTGLAGMLAVIIYRYQPQWTEGYWIILAAAFLLQTRLGHSQLQQMSTVFICGLLAALLAYIAGFFWHHLILLACYLALTTFFTIYIGVLGFHAAVSGFFINLFVIMSAGLMTTPSGQTERFCMIMLGDLLALSMCLLFPTGKLDFWYASLKNYFLSLSEFSEMLATVRNKKFKAQFHERRSRISKFIEQIRSALHDLELVKPTKITQSSQWVEQLERVNKAMIALTNRYDRFFEALHKPSVSDNIQSIFQSISTFFADLAHQKELDNSLVILRSNIDQLQLHIIEQKLESLEPAVTFLFITENLYKELAILAGLDYDF